MSKILIALCAFVILAIPPSVYADPIVVTSGFISVTGLSGNGPQYSLMGENFSITGGGGDPGASPSCFPCTSGELINVNSVFVGTSFGQASGTINGFTFDNLNIGGNVQLTGSPVLVPAALTNVSITAPFVFSGLIVGCEGSTINCGNTVFSTDLVGQGIVTIQLNFLQVNASGNSVYVLSNVTYTFQSSEIPEPMTVLLLASGLFGLGAKLKSGNKRT